MLQATVSGIIRRMKRRYNLAKKDKDILAANLATCLREAPDIDFAYLFGSFLADDSFGDIDIGVVFTNDGGARGEIALEQALEPRIDYPLDVVDLSAATISFRFRVISTGRLLMRKDDNRRCDFEEKTMVTHADVRPIHKQWHREVFLGPR